jgi:large subunit ribosomal protein L1
MKHGKKYREAMEKVDVTKVYGIEEGVKLVKEMAFAKFDETVEVSVNLNIKKSQSVRDTFVLPHQFAAEKRFLSLPKATRPKKLKKPVPLMSVPKNWSRKSRAAGWISISVSPLPI